MKFEEMIFGLRNAKEFPEHYEEVSELAIDLLERTRWIPVSERLPEYSDYVLAVFEKCLPFVAMYYSGVKKFSCEGEEANPTHWMTLPNPPQEVE